MSLRPSRTFLATLVRREGMCFIPLPFDPAASFGRVRAPVIVSIRGYEYRSTIATMGGPPCIPLRRSHREAAGLEGTERVRVTLTLDTEARTVIPPPDLVKALDAVPGGWEAWQALGFTHQREHVEAIEAAKRPETRGRRIEKAVAMVLGRMG